jgi:hypothetical protein
MTPFLCLAVPPNLTPRIRAVFKEPVSIKDASEFPIAKATMGDWITWPAYLLQIEAGSSRLVFKEFRKRTHNNDRSELLVSGLQGLMESSQPVSVAFLYHVFTGLLLSEIVSVRDEVIVPIEDIAGYIPDRLEEDTRYVVRKSGC